METNNLCDLDGNPLANPLVLAGVIEKMRKFAHSDKYMNHNFMLDRDACNALLRKCQGKLLKVTLSLARQYNQRFVSIGANDLIAGRYDNGWRKDEPWAWDAAKALGVSMGCGNGMGEYCGQYQIYGEKFYASDDLGIWNPFTEQRVYDRAFHLRSGGKWMDELYKAMTNSGSKRLNALLSSEGFINAMQEERWR